MKKILSIAVLLMAILAGLNACDNDDDSKGAYSYVVPCLQWNSSMDEVRNYMKEVKGWNSSSSQLGNYDLIFRQEKTHNDITYTFHNGKLTRVTVTWYSCQEEFEKMREEYAHNLGFTWQDNSGDVYSSYHAVSHELHCDISVHRSELNGLQQMGITFDYAESY